MSVLSKILDFFAKAGSQMNQVGTLLVFAGSTIPTGYLLCDGSEVSRTTYAKLFSVINTTYGKGDSSSTFNLPDFRNKTLWGANSNVGETFTSGLPNITGQASWIRRGLSDYPQNGAFTTGTSGNAATVGSNNRTVTAVRFDASRANSIYGASNIVQPPAIAVNVIIKY